MQHAIHLLAAGERPLRVANNVAVVQVQVGPHPGRPVRRPRPGWPAARLGQHVSNGARTRCQDLEFGLVDFVQLVRGHHGFLVFRLRTIVRGLARAPRVSRAHPLLVPALHGVRFPAPLCAGPSYRRISELLDGLWFAPGPSCRGRPRAALPAGPDRTRQWRSLSTPSSALEARRPRSRHRSGNDVQPLPGVFVPARPSLQQPPR